MIVPLLNFYTNVFAPYLGDSAAVLALEEVKPYPVGIRKPQPCAPWRTGEAGQEVLSEYKPQGVV